MNNPKITKIYLDLDGVICDFHKRYTELFGTLPERDDKSKTFHKNFDTFIEVRSFATLDMMPGAITLIRSLEKLPKNDMMTLKHRKKNGFRNIMLHSSKTLFQVNN